MDTYEKGSGSATKVALDDAARQLKHEGAPAQSEGLVVVEIVGK